MRVLHNLNGVCPNMARQRRRRDMIRNGKRNVILWGFGNAGFGSMALNLGTKAIQSC